MSYTESWIRVREKLRGWWGDLGEHLAPQPAPFSLLPPRLTITRTEAPSPALAPAQAPALATPASVSSSQPAPSSAIEPRFEVEKRRLSIPIRGSLRGSRSYLLAQPAGIAINLPNAQPLVKFGDFEIQKEGFRAVWVRRRAGGLHIRVFFSESFQPTLSLGERKLTVELKSAELKGEQESPPR